MAFDFNTFGTPAQTATKKPQQTNGAGFDFRSFGQSGTTLRQQQGQAEPSQYGAFFPAKKEETIVGAAAKTAGNLPSSAWNFVKGAASFLNPIRMYKEIKENYQTLREGGLSPKQIFTQGVQNLPYAVGETAKGLVPEAARGAFTYGTNELRAALTSDLDKKAELQQKGAEALQKAQTAIIEDPVGSVAPLLIAARGTAKMADARAYKGQFAEYTKGLAEGKPTPLPTPANKYGRAFDTAVEKTGQLVTKPVAAVADATGRGISTATKFGLSQATGLSPETITQVPQNPAAFSRRARTVAGDRAALGQEVQSSLAKRIEALEQTGEAYKPFRESTTPVKVAKDFLQSAIEEIAGVKIKKGVVSTTGEAMLRDATDVRGLQKLYDLWKPVFARGKMTANEFLNFREDLANLSKFERQIGKSRPLENVAKLARKRLNEAYRPQLEGLEKLDETFRTQRVELKKLSKGMVDRDGNLTETAMNRIANATGKGKDLLLERLEETTPGITQKIKTLKAVEDIQHASGIKVGAYTRTGLTLGAGLAGGLPIALLTAILTSPQLAVPLLRVLGLIKNSVAVKTVVGTLKSGANRINQLPATTGNLLQKKPEQIRGKIGLSIEDISKLPKDQIEAMAIAIADDFANGRITESQAVKLISELIKKEKGNDGKAKIPKYLEGVAEEAAAFRGKKRGVIDDETFLYIDDWKNIDAGNLKENIATKPPSQNVINRLSEFRPEKPITLYRGVRPNQKMGTETGYESWSKSKNVAKGFGKVESRLFNPDEILVDFDKLPRWMDDINGNVEKEVIVKRKKSTFGKIDDSTPKTKANEVKKNFSALEDEARKYKSAEEFVKAKGKPVYHATDALFDDFNPSMNPDDVGTWFAKNKADVLDPEVSKTLPIVKEQVMKPGTKLITEEQLSKFEQSKFVLDSNKPIHELLMEKGYRGIEYGNDTIQLFEPNIDTISKSQLTDLWNKANEKKSTLEKPSAFSPKDKGTEAPKTAVKFYLPKNPQQQAIFERAAKWVTDWVSGKRLKEPDAEVQQYFKQFNPKKPVNLNRGAGSGKESTTLKSWSYNDRTAKEFGIESGKARGQTFTQKVSPDQILVDIGNIAYHSDIFDAILNTIKNKKIREEVEGFMSGEGEVVVRPKSNFGK